ncbi:MAG: hypothetical protein Satyrvirus48_4 [Satyrvirus sp.]|uniref:Uncharacterized protein n=1 Tax=Satyrvirus sp. TaxID=2487771 RepID=A0A3G5AF69_9VIRU|nr:MAG: hypothetical protein Satyrvirus48_4 [Satyrvirus sp.]
MQAWNLSLSLAVGIPSRRFLYLPSKGEIKSIMLYDCDMVYI